MRGTVKRQILLALLFLNAVLVLCGQLMLSFEVNFKEVKHVTSLSTFRYNLWIGAGKLYDADLKVLAMLLVAWSGVWPYVKLAAMGSTLFLSHKLSPRTLSRLLNAIAFLGKVSLLDLSFVMLVIVSISFDTIVGWAQAVALEGAFVFALSIVSSQILGHFLPGVIRDCAEESTSLSATYRYASHSSSQSPPQLAHAVHPYALAVLVTVTGALLAVGLVTPALEVHYFFKVFGMRVQISERVFSFVQSYTLIWTNVRLDRLNLALALYSAACVVVVPVIMILLMYLQCIALIWRNRPATQFIARIIRFVRHWTLHEVHLLAALVAVFELENIGQSLSSSLELVVTPHHAMWYLLGAIGMEIVCVVYGDALTPPDDVFDTEEIGLETQHLIASTADEAA